MDNPSKIETKIDIAREDSKQNRSDKNTEKLRERKKIDFSALYDKSYKGLFILYIVIFVLIIGQLAYQYATTGDIMNKGVSLTGGTSVIIHTSEEISINELQTFLESKLGEEVNVRKLNDITSSTQTGIIIESKVNSDILVKNLEDFLGYEINSNNSTIEETGEALSKGFYNQLGIALIIAFILMGMVVFIIFKDFIPSVAVIFAAITDVLGALAISNLVGIEMSAGGIAALLMLVGYSVDTDLMLTTKVLKRRGEKELNKRIFDSFKTGITMTLTSLLAVLIAFILVESPILKQIFFILSAGLFIDLLSTWIGNASILKLYCQKKGFN